MLNITPTSIFPLKYPKGDSTIPEKGAMAVPVDLDWSKSTSYSVSLLVVQEQKFFGSLRCMWIDASANTHPITVAVNGTEQVFTVAAGSANYYAVVNLNIPVVSLTIGAGEATLTRVIFLNFVPEISMAGQVSIAGTVTVSGNVAVSNFPALQKVDLADVGGSAITLGQALMAKSLPVVIASDQSAHPVTQSGAWAVSVSNFPATQPVSGTVAATQSGAWSTGRTWNLSSATDSISAVQSGAWAMSISGTPGMNVAQYGGTATTLGQKVMASSMPVTLASDQSALAVSQSGAWNVGITGTPSFNLSQVGGAAIALGQTTMTKSVPVVIASDQSAIPVKGSAIGVSTQIVNSTTPTNLTSTINNTITHVTISSVGAVVSGGGGTVNLSVTDGSGVLRLFFALPVATSTALAPYIVCDFQNIVIPLVNSGVAATIKLSVNLTSGVFVFGFGLAN